MKRNYLLLAGIALGCSAYANAAEGPADNQGLSGEISLLAAFSGGKSNFNTDHAVKTGDLNSAGESDSEFMPIPLGQVRYTFGTQQLFLGTSRADIIEGVVALELGYAFEVGENSRLSFSYLPTIVNGETWENPYLVNSSRKTTDVSGNAYRIQYDNVLDTGIDADFAYYDKEIENEQSGSTTAEQELLKRGGSGYLVQVSYGRPVGRSTFIMPSLEYQRYSADGKAMSYDRYGFSLTGMHSFGNHHFSLNGGYSKTKYDAENPIFNQTQENSIYSVMFAYEYSSFMGWENLGFNVLSGYETTSSNITFYDESEYITGIGVTYFF
ncbi:DUF2860 domain-containing protein [Psychromonas aquimarina]|uniref:DUF2860 domain-containing protein n=1 Tax=Psychromonas aquimarina TaxID=444919 RepID=UPI000412C3EB|nr:DUF2860 domain-containing protein [Psychromonas aquimarina]